MSREKLEQGLELHQAGDLVAAEKIYREVLAEDAHNPDAHHFLGLIAQQKGDLSSALDLIGTAIAIAPDRPTFHFNLAVTYAELGQLEKAAETYEQACKLKPDWVDAVLGLGTVLGQLGKYVPAERSLRAVLKVEPNRLEALIGLAASLEGQGDSIQAEKFGRAAVAADPKSPEAWVNLGNALNSQAGTPGKLGEAEEAFRQAISLNPNYAVANYNLGNVFNDQWRPDEALKSFQAAIDVDSAYQSAWQNYLLNLLYRPGTTEQKLYEVHSAWAKTLPSVDLKAATNKTGLTGQRIKVGYVSPDFRTHSCAYFLKPLFEAHDRNTIEIFAFANVRRADQMTEWFKENADHWHNIFGRSDDVVAAQIAEDQIDILVDLAGHSAGNRLGVFALKPAPLQISWLGYPATTGLSQIDFRLTDAIADPQISDNTERFHSERLLRLEGGFHCYQAPVDVPPAGPLPAVENGYVTFGSFNHIAKLTSETVEIWAEILQAVPSSKLLLKSGMLGYGEVSEAVYEMFEKKSISTDRLDLRGWIKRDDPLSGHPMALYNSVDIGLDTFPYNGTTTSFEALTMGVPVITFKGDRHAARVGASILTHIGFPEWIAENRQVYVEKAQTMAADLTRLQNIRFSLRDKLQKSSLGNAELFAQKLETLYRDLKILGLDQ